MTSTTTAKFSALLNRQEQEREALAARLLEEERTEARKLLANLRPDAGAALIAAVAEIETQVRRDVRADKLLARVATDVPALLDAQLPPLDPDDAAAGRKAVAIYVARPFADGRREAAALGVIDLTDAIFGKGAGAQRLRDQAEVVAAEQARDDAVLRREYEAASRR